VTSYVCICLLLSNTNAVSVIVQVHHLHPGTPHAGTQSARSATPPVPDYGCAAIPIGLVWSPPGFSNTQKLDSAWHPVTETESQNHRMVGVGRDLCGSPSPTPLLKQGHLQQAVEDLVQAGLEYLQRRREMCLCKSLTLARRGVRTTDVPARTQGMEQSSFPGNRQEFPQSL